MDPQHDPVQLMLVDDHAIIRQSMKFLLEHTGWIEVVGEAENGLQAIERAERLQPNVILMDYNMPVLDGVQATRGIHKTNPQITIIGLTMGDEAVARRMVEAGASHCISKRSDIEELKTVIGREAGRFT